MILKVFTLLVITLFSMAFLAGCADSTTETEDTNTEQEESVEETEDSVDETDDSEDGTEESSEDADSEGDEISNEIDITLTNGKITPSSIEVKKGETVTLNVSNEGSISHTYTIEALGEEIKLASGESGILEVTFDESGELSVICSEPGHAANGMVGDIEVIE